MYQGSQKIKISLGCGYLYIQYVYELATPKPPIQINLTTLYNCIKIFFSAGNSKVIMSGVVTTPHAYTF